MEQSEQSTTGLEWVKTTFSLEPRWTVDVDPELIKPELKEYLHTSHVDVQFLAQGAFNKVYTVHADGETFVLRVSLPVDPRWKTTSEVATLGWICHNTTLPVPKVITYDANQANPLGFEWILMTHIPGMPLASVREATSFEAKQEIVRQLARFTSNLFEKQWGVIGNIYPRYRNGLLTTETSREVGRMVSMSFFWGGRSHPSIPRGPFSTSGEWMRARLARAEGDCRLVLIKSEDEDDREDAARTLSIVQRLQSLLEVVFPNAGEPEPCMLHHDDLSQQNIMVDKWGTLTGVVDWECVSVVPLWKACNYPSFLEGSSRPLPPDKNSYRRDAQGQPDSLYWEHRWEHERTLLRGDFWRHMQALQPPWVEVFRQSQLQRDFDCAVLHSDSEFSARQINGWIDDIISGQHRPESLCSRMYALSA